MKVLEWLNNNIVANNLLCDKYINLVNNAKSKKQLFDICADSNGVSFLCEMRARGYPLDYEIIKEEFGNYINGKYIVKYEAGYTSAIYCQCEQNIEVETTIACFLGCNTEVHFRPYTVSRICVDEKCHLKIYCPKNTNVTIEYYGEDSTIEIIEGIGRVNMVLGDALPF